MRGESVAAAAVVELLRRAGIGTGRVGAAAARVPAVMMGGATRRLFADVFAMSDDPFAGLWPIGERYVKWGAAPVARVPHQAWVATGRDMERWIGGAAAGESVDASWTVYAGGPAGRPGGFRAFGERRAQARRVTLREGAAAHASYAEALPAGWLFLLPVSGREAWLLTVGEDSLGESSLVAGVVDSLGEAGGEFAAAPWLAAPVGGEGWLCCGAAAAGFDPLCGDGVGNALREAILAAAVIAAGEGIAHYERQLCAAMMRHLQACGEFYSGGGSGAWWAEQREACVAGWRLLGRELEAAGPARYRLVDFSLVPVG